VAERGGEHRLANAGRPDDDQIGSLIDEAQRGEVFDQAPVERGLGAEVELLDRFARRELGEAQASLEAALFDGVDFGGEQLVQELGVAGFVVFGGFQRWGEPVGDGGAGAGRRVARAVAGSGC